MLINIILKLSFIAVFDFQMSIEPRFIEKFSAQNILQLAQMYVLLVLVIQV